MWSIRREWKIRNFFDFLCELCYNKKSEDPILFCLERTKRHMSNGNTPFENALENMQRHEGEMGGINTDMHSEIKTLRVAIKNALKECGLHQPPYDIRKDNRHWDIHFDYQIDADVKTTMTAMISKKTGIKEENINIRTMHS